MPAGKGSNLPIIVCLHGRGANSTILQVQARRLAYNLRQVFRFIFVEAPFESEAGPGVLPVFEGEGPFSCWTSRRVVIDLSSSGSGDDNKATLDDKAELLPEEDREIVLRTIDAAVEDEGATWESVIGVLGFSQGARLAAGLLMHQLLQDRFDDPTFGTDIKTNFQFGVLIGGQKPPLVVSEVNTNVDPQKLKPRLERDYEVLKTIPTVHAWGREDPWLEQCKQLAAVCAGELCFKMDFDGGHHLPLTDPEANELCLLIQRAQSAAEARQWSQFGG